MTIDQINGFLYFVFYDRRNHTGVRTDVYMAISKDGGETFTNFKISDTPFNADSDVFFGDYIGISAHNDVIRPVWPRMDNSQLSLWTAIVDPSLFSDVKHGENQTLPEKFAIKSIYPNPFNPSTKISFTLIESGQVTLKIINMLGKTVKTLVKDFKTVGNHEITFSADNLASGVYIALLQQGECVNARKLILFK